MFIRRLHPGLFGISLGLISLSGTWRKFSQLEMTPNLNMENLLFALGTATLSSLTLLFLIKLIIDIKKGTKKTNKKRHKLFHPAHPKMISINE